MVLGLVGSGEEVEKVVLKGSSEPFLGGFWTFLVI